MINMEVNFDVGFSLGVDKDFKFYMTSATPFYSEI
jgi:hypothetical protein